MARQLPKVYGKNLRHRYLHNWWPEPEAVVLSNATTVASTRYRYRGVILTPGTEPMAGLGPWREVRGRRMR
ncbi:MAG: hypothetical protein M0Z54_13285 [Thermaerobacter sp.]|nr:hypothetical protein [Thermaerobacter sp.]